jgi:hypothetical protein
MLMALAAGLVVLFRFNPGESGFYPFCFFHRATGLLCPGCGALRAMHQLLHGHLAAALRLNALFVLSLPLLVWCAACFVRAAFRARPVSLPAHPAWYWSAFVVVVLFGILRNLPSAHLAWLAP